jgi:single-strand DNA-binding protein
MSGKATIELIGRLSKEPEMRYVGDKAVTKLSIPVQERKDGETTWYTVNAWEKQAEVLNQYATKGTWLWIRGIPKIETWQDRTTGETKHAFSVTLREFTFCGGGESSNGETPEQPTRQQPGKYIPPGPQKQAPRNAPVAVDDDSDLPF